MRYVRCSLYDGDGRFINVLLFSEETVNADGIDLHSFANGVREEFGPRADVEIFEHQGAKSEAHNEAAKRSGERIPQGLRDSAALRDWVIAMFFLAKNEAAVIGTKSVAPIPAIAVSAALHEVSQHPSYKRQRVVVASDDGKIVTLANGKITIDLFGGKA